MAITDIIRQDAVNDVLEGVPFGEYLAMKWLSGSPIATGVARSAKHLVVDYETAKASTDPMRIGRATDCLLFECMLPAMQRHATRQAAVQDAIEQFQERFPLWGGGRRDRRTDKWREFSDAAGDDYIKDLAEFNKVTAQVSAVVTDPVAAEHWEEGLAQLTLLAVEEDDIQCKGRPDWVCTSLACLDDLKTTADLTRFWRVAFDKGYHVKFALYRRWWRRIKGVSLPCNCIVVEQGPPHDVAVIPFPDGVLDAAEERVTWLLRELRTAIYTGEFKGVADGREYLLQVPGYIEDDGLEWESGHE